MFNKISNARESQTKKMTRQFVDTTEVNHLVNKFYVSKNIFLAKLRPFLIWM